VSNCATILVKSRRCSGLPPLINKVFERISGTIEICVYEDATLAARDLTKMVVQLDTKRKIRQEDTEVIYLKYLPAETFALVVQNLLDNYLAELEGTKSQRRGATITGRSATRSSPSLTGSFNLQNPLSNQAGGGVGASVRQLTSEPAGSGSYGPRVQWEGSTNSLIITAPKDLISRVKQVVTQLDIRRPQVLIEAIIAECTLDKDLELGIEWREFNNQFNTRFNPTGPLTKIDSVTGNYSAAGVLGAVGSGLTLGIFKNMSLRFLLRALKGDANTNILATPNIMTLDNEPALIKIGRLIITINIVITIICIRIRIHCCWICRCLIKEETLFL